MPIATPENPEVPELRRLLVVDDEEIVLVALRETLIRAGYEVVATGDAEEALEFLRGAPFAAIITDQQMPRMTGLEFLSRAKEIQPDATRILITAVLNLSTVIEAINKGEIYRFIIKPWLREEFLGAVESAVQRHRLASGNARLRTAAVGLDATISSLNRELEQERAVNSGQRREVEQLQRAQAEAVQRSIELCVRTMELFHPILGIQSRRVSALCRALAQATELSPADQEALTAAGSLFDLGWIGIPRRLIRSWEQSPASVTEADRALIHLHPAVGAELVSSITANEALAAAIRAHHERFDGTGYPGRLAGDAIPWIGRLLAVTVSYAESPEEHAITVQMISARSGAAFDPRAVAVFMRALPRAVIPRKQREVSVTDLRPGMVLAQGIYTATGLLLVPGDHELSESYINKLRNHHQINPIARSLFVYC